VPAALEVAFNTGAETAKGRALRGHRRVSLLVDDETPPFSFVKLTGRVTLREDLVEVRACATRIGGAIWVSTEPRSSVPATACWASCSFGCGLTGCSPSGPSPDDASKSIRRRGGAALDEEAHGALRGRRPGHERLTAVVGDAARRGSVAALADLIDNDAVHAGVLQLGTPVPRSDDDGPDETAFEVRLRTGVASASVSPSKVLARHPGWRRDCRGNRAARPRT